MTLTEFLTARLDEDEVAVNLRTRRMAPTGHGFLEQFGDFGDDERWMIEIPAGRVLAEVAFKRKAVEFYLQLCDVEGVHKYVSGTAARQAVETVLLDMAAIWADHADYRQEWAS